MTILLDTNIIMDALQERQPFDAAAKEILRRGISGEVTVCFTANVASDIFYLYTKARDLQSARSAMTYLIEHYSVVSVTHGDCRAAMALPIDDFEDALVAVCASNAGVDYIVTRDEKFLNVKPPVPVITPDALLGMLNNVSAVSPNNAQK